MASKKENYKSDKRSVRRALNRSEDPNPQVRRSYGCTLPHSVSCDKDED